MYLTRLDLFGFKSFARKTEIHFHDGITAIVGPNGCGKSNIVDAIRWVLGEQKAGTLRSESMQNVIFNGTRTHKPLGMAEVSITIQNNRGVLPIEYSEVTITRRLFRSGESQYLLNNSVCRLKDILDLFMDTGVGPNAYSVIELNMVEKILNGRPEERRQIFEEAAGVTKYKLRRKAAFRKLEATEQDLIRLTDIISEVEKTVNSLRRQVARAQRYKGYTDELQQLELDYSAYHLARIRSELQPLTASFTEVRKQREEISSQLAGEEAQIEKKQLEILEIERQLNARRNDLHANTRRIQEKEEEILVSQERVKAAEQARERAKRDIVELERRLTALQEEKESLHTAVAEAEARLAEVEKRLQQARGRLSDIQSGYAEKRGKAEDLERERLKTFERLSELREKQERLNAQMEYVQQQRELLKQEATELQEKAKTAASRLHELQVEKATLVEEQSGVVEAANRAAGHVEALRKSIETARQEHLELQSRLRHLRDRADMLRRFMETYEDYPEGVKYLLQENLVDRRRSGVVGELLQVDDRYRKAIETALGEAAVALVVEQADEALKAIEHLKHSGKGAVTFLPLEQVNGQPAAAAVAAGLEKIDGFEGRALDLIQAPAEVRRAAEVLLDQVYVARDLASAMEVAKRLREVRAAVVTLDGEIAYSWGALRGGESEASEASLVGRRAVVEALDQEISEMETGLEKSQQNLAGLQEQMQEKESRLQELEGQKSELTRRLQQVEVAIERATVEQQQARQRLEETSEKIAFLDERLSALQHDSDALAPLFADLEAQRQSIESRYAGYRAELESIETELKQAEEEVQGIHLEFATRQAELRNDQQTLERLLRTEQDLQTTLKRRHDEVTMASETIDSLSGRIRELREELQDDFAERKELEDVISEIEREYQARKEDIEQRDRALRKARAARDQVSDQVHDMELRISKLQMQEKNLIDHIRETYDVDLAKHPAPESLEEQAVSQRINELKQKIRAIGPVNMLALKDYETEKERLDFLLSQKEDLLKAEANLKETIRVINKTAYERFNQVFSRVRENFIQVFQSFFENGSADLRLQGDDPLEAEIIIEANPKGRKLGSLALLSGGEKALTAISLLFALYLVKPSPFCILDEVDAPLDDTNVRRFTSALKKFSDNTQFIIVTHNKLTMQAANQLYGITMEEPGISKVVSVKFEGQESKTATLEQSE